MCSFYLHIHYDVYNNSSSGLPSLTPSQTLIPNNFGAYDTFMNSSSGLPSLSPSETIRSTLYGGF